MKGDKSKSVLFEACRLAKMLESLEMGARQKWEMVSDVWVEMLCHAATHCGWIQHGQQLRRGGELLTHVSLLMAHLGFNEQFQIAEGETGFARSFTEEFSMRGWNNSGRYFYNLDSGVTGQIRI